MLKGKELRNKEGPNRTMSIDFSPFNSSFLGFLHKLNVLKRTGLYYYEKDDEVSSAMCLLYI